MALLFGNTSACAGALAIICGWDVCTGARVIIYGQVTNTLEESSAFNHLKRMGPLAQIFYLV